MGISRMTVKGQVTIPKPGSSGPRIVYDLRDGYRDQRAGERQPEYDPANPGAIVPGATLRARGSLSTGSCASAATQADPSCPRLMQSPDGVGVAGKAPLRGIRILSASHQFPLLLSR